MKLDITIPSYDEMESMTMEELKEWQNKLAPYYEERFEMNFEDSMKARKFLSFVMMIQNIEKGLDKWSRIDHSRLAVHKKIVEDSSTRS